MKRKLLRASVLGFLAGMLLMFLIGLIPLKNASYWQGRYIGALEKIQDIEEELHIYELNQAKIEIHDRRTWGTDTTIGATFIHIPSDWEQINDTIWMWVDFISKDTFYFNKRGERVYYDEVRGDPTVCKECEEKSEEQNNEGGE